MTLTTLPFSAEVKHEYSCICLDVFNVTKFFDIFSGKQLCDDIKILQHFRDRVSL
jgi:hypothetical protein